MQDNTRNVLGDTLRPPESIELERQLIADAIFNPDTQPELVSLLTPDMFSSVELRNIWSTIARMFNNGEHIDLISVKQKVGRVFVQEVIARNIQPGGSVSTMQHAALLRDASARRRMYNAALKMLDASMNPSLSEDDIIGFADTEVKSIQGDAASNDDISLIESINRVSEELHEQTELVKEGRAIKAPSGIPAIDRYTRGGFAPGELVILAARPSVGKTSLMLHMAKTAAESGRKPMIFSLEMTDKQLTKKLLYSTNYVSPDTISPIKGVDWRSFETAAGKISDLGITINYKSRTLQQITSRIILNVIRGRCDIVFIDYLTLIKTLDKLEKRFAIGQITRDLKQIALQYGIPIVLLAQLNRDSAKDGRPPQLFDLRDSGDIEQDSDIVLMLEDAGIKNRINLWLRKNRDGAKELCVALETNDTKTYFREIGTDEEPQSNFITP